MNHSYRRVTSNFAAATRSAKKILAIEIAGLGDLIHSLPALWALRQGYPDAQLHCLVQTGNASLLRLTPWIDRIIPYRRGTAGSLSHHLNIARRLRAEHYDIAIDFMGADYSAIVARISGARHRLLRKSGHRQGHYGWRLLNTEVMEASFTDTPMYEQRLRCVEQAGFALPQSRFELEDAAVASNASDRGNYVHVSPYTKLTRKELPPEQMLQLLVRVQQDFPQTRLVLTCSNKPRELVALRQLLAALPFAPWKVFAGTLDIPELFGWIKGAALHLGGDSGAMHLAWLAGTPSISWFRHFGNFNAWVAQGPQHAVVSSDCGSEDFLHGIDIDNIIDLAEKFLQMPRVLPRANARFGASNQRLD